MLLGEMYVNALALSSTLRDEPSGSDSNENEVEWAEGLVLSKVEGF